MQKKSPPFEGAGGRQPAELTPGAGGTLSTSAAKGSGTASGAGTGAWFGVAGCFGATARLGAAGRGTRHGFGDLARCDDRFDILVADGLDFDALGSDALAVDALGFETLGFETLGFDALGFDALARTFVPTAAFRGAAALARTCSAVCAALAFFLACFAAFLLAFANFRARLSTFLAARTSCFAASARATAVAASAFSRCAEAARFGCASDDREIATVRCLAKTMVAAELSPRYRGCHPSAALQCRVDASRQHAEQEFANVPEGVRYPLDREP